MNETVTKISPKEIVTVCRNCGANLNGKAKCEYCDAVYPENMFYLERQEDTEARKRADALMACGLFHTELSEIDEDIERENKMLQKELNHLKRSKFIKSFMLLDENDNYVRDIREADKITGYDKEVPEEYDVM